MLGIGFAGIKGFCGGFGPRALGPWGESLIKQFVQEAVGEALKLETALARLRARTRIALLHYSPIQRTCPRARRIYPFLGSSRLEEPLVRYLVLGDVSRTRASRTAGRQDVNGSPVFNVSWPLLTRHWPERPFHVIELRGDNGVGG